MAPSTGKLSCSLVWSNKGLLHITGEVCLDVANYHHHQWSLDGCPPPPSGYTLVRRPQLAQVLHLWRVELVGEVFPAPLDCTNYKTTYNIFILQQLIHMMHDIVDVEFCCKWGYWYYFPVSSVQRGQLAGPLPLTSTCLLLTSSLQLYYLTSLHDPLLNLQIW